MFGLSNYEILSLALSFLTVLVLYFNLRAVKKSSAQTGLLADAALAQIPRPFIEIHQQPDQTDEAIVESVTHSIGDLSTIRFKNSGTGQAVNIRYEIRPADGRLALTDEAVDGPTILLQDFDTNHSRNALHDPAAFLICYESLNGNHYVTSGIIEGRRWVRDSKFVKLSQTIPPAPSI